MSCVREASPPLSEDHLRHDMKKRRFLQPLRGLRRIFRKKGRTAVISTTTDEHAGVNGLRDFDEHLDLNEQTIDTNLEPAKSHSTSHLDDDQTDNTHRSSLQSTTLLSVSHDSVFTSEQRSPNSGSETSLYVVRSTRLGFPNSSVRAELFEAVRSRRLAQENNVSDDEDLGLPRSPISNSPTTANDLITKEHNITKSSQSTCSDGSLLSMGSSEIDEESYCYNSRHSSKLSLHERRTSIGSDLQHNDRSTHSSNGADAASLSHSAAKHKMAVKPKRNHGAPHKKRQVITSNMLPTTPELNEESNLKNSISSVTVVSGKDTSNKTVADSGQSDKHQLNQNHVCISPQSRTDNNTSVTQITPASKQYSDQSKYCSLPPLVSVSPAPSFRLLARSKSNATPCTNTENASAVSDENEPPKREDGSSSFFSRLLLRRSSKKKKNSSDKPDTSSRDSNSLSHPEVSLPTAIRSWPTSPEDNFSLPSLQEEPISMAYVNGDFASAMKHHPLFRQRIEPPKSPPLSSHDDTGVYGKVSYSSTVPVNMEHCSSSPHSMLIDTSREQQQQQHSVQKSHSFRQSDKLPYSVCEDTPSLPFNIGLIEEDPVIIPTSAPPTVINVSEDIGLSKRCSHTSSESSILSDCSEREKFEHPVTPVMGVGALIGPSRWKNTASKSILDYENLAAVSKLSISVNEGVDIGVPSVEIVTEAKPAISQTSSEVKIPVPAPRTSLLNRTPSNSQLVERSKSGSSSSSSNCSLQLNDNLNVTVTESPDRQRSIISISSNDFAVTTADLMEAAAVEMATVRLLEPSDEDMNAVDKVDDLDDDVFQPYIASSSMPSVNDTFSLDEYSPETEIMDAPDSYTSEAPMENIVEIVSSKHDTIEKRVESEPLSAKPVVVTDFNAGIIKVNDTTVVIRKKTPQPKRDEEPELMKVFARRSLKLKETDNLEDALYDSGGHKSRDSDKENEDANAVTPVDEQPPQSRKRKVEAPDAVIAAVPPKPATFGRFQRSVSHDTEKVVLANSQANHVNDKRQRCKSASTMIHDVDKCDVDENKGALAPPNTPVGNEEKPVTPFKRIQQRREEWEKRAQQAMKVHGIK